MGRIANSRAKFCAQLMIFKHPGSLLRTVLRWWFWCNSYFIGVLCRISYSIVSYLYASFSGMITSVWEEIANFSAIGYL